MPTRSPTSTAAWTCARTSDRHGCGGSQDEARNAGSSGAAASQRGSGWLAQAPGLCRLPGACRSLRAGYPRRRSRAPIRWRPCCAASGDWTLRLLLVTLAVTPLRRVTGWVWPLRAASHARPVRLLLRHAAPDRLSVARSGAAGSEILVDLTERPYITLGFPPSSF